MKVNNIWNLTMNAINDLVLLQRIVTTFLDIPELKSIWVKGECEIEDGDIRHSILSVKVNGSDCRYNYEEDYAELPDWLKEDKQEFIEVCMDMIILGSNNDHSDGPFEVLITAAQINKIEDYLKLVLNIHTLFNNLKQPLLK